MPVKTSSGKWKWGNIERDSKKELVQTVYGIWKKNGSKGSFSKFLKGTHESINESKVIEDRLYFHGTRYKKNKLEPPQPYKPFFVSGNLEYAMSYANVDSEHDSCVYLVKLNSNANVFDPTNEEDLKRLESLNFWPKEVIDKLQNGDDILQIMNYASTRKLIDSLKGSGAITHRDQLCKQLKQLGYDMFKTKEDSDGYESDLVYGVFTMNGLDSLYPKAISLDKVREIDEMFKSNKSTSEILNAI